MKECANYICRNYETRCWLRMQVEGQVRDGKYDIKYLDRAHAMAYTEGEECFLVDEFTRFLFSLPIGLSAEDKSPAPEK